MMRSFKYWPVIFVVCSIGAIAFLREFTRPAPGTIAYHRQRLGELRQRQTWRWGPDQQRPSSTAKTLPAEETAYLNPKTWLWFLAGRPTIASLHQQQEEQQQALIRLGYFERRELNLSHRNIDQQFWKRFNPSISNSPLCDRQWFIFLDGTRPSTIRVTACKADMAVFERIVHEIDIEACPTNGWSQ